MFRESLVELYPDLTEDLSSYSTEALLPKLHTINHNLQVLAKRKNYYLDLIAALDSRTTLLKEASKEIQVTLREREGKITKVGRPSKKPKPLKLSEMSQEDLLSFYNSLSEEEKGKILRLLTSK